LTDKYWGNGTPFKNKVAFFTYIRGCLRKAWNRHPVKLTKLNTDRKRIKNPNPKGKVPDVWGFKCELCEKDYTMKDCQVDHIIPCGSLQEATDIQGFTERLLFVTMDDLRLVCKDCNSILAYSDKNGTTIAEATAIKNAILILKNKEDKNFFSSRKLDKK
jgi:hypothetical protein